MMCQGWGSRVRNVFALWILVPVINGFAAEPTVPGVGPAAWPREVVVTIGDIRTRVDGPKMWTLSGIDFQNSMMATQDSAYGTVLTIRNVGHLGTAHFLDVPGKPGKIETEDVTALRFFVDGKRVNELSPMLNLSGNAFRMERKSRIRDLDLETTITISDGVLTETARFKANAPIDLQKAHPWMYAWTAQAQSYVFGENEEIRRRGNFAKPGKTVAEVIKHANWVAVYDPATRKGSVCCYRSPAPQGGNWFLLVDAPGIYRKVAGYVLEDKIVPAGFEATYQAAVGFFNADEQNWEEQARHRARELRAIPQSP